MQKPKVVDPVELTDLIREKTRAAFGDILKITSDFAVTREKGYYGICYGMPSRNLRNALSVDREILVLISTFEDQQTRTVQTAKDIIQDSNGRLDSSTFVVIHRDRRGSAKLKKWGREQGLAVLPIFFDGDLPTGDAVLQTLSHELFSYDVFDVTGPVADDLHFYGRREEARELAKKLQTGQIRSCFGIRKIGKTSILHRVIKEVDENYECTTILIDAQRDAVFELSAAQLINSLALSLERSASLKDNAVVPDHSEVTVSVASERLRTLVSQHDSHILFVFDEVDYLTPSSPTAVHWKNDFNPFWRNIRAIYQSVSGQKNNLSILVSGVSSKWFAEESIHGVENAALSFVPEEYLSPLPRGAAGAMIRRLGRTSGLVFNDDVAEVIASTCADMPFWIRKACSFIHAKIDVGLRPFEPQKKLITDYLKEFIASDGTAMAEVALSHLFRVYPELKAPAFSCADGRALEVSLRTRRILQKYGLVGVGSAPTVSGAMMTTGLRHLEEDTTTDQQAPSAASQNEMSDFGEWADELAIISRRRNILEKKLRALVGNFVRFGAMSNTSLGSSKERVLKCIDVKRRTSLEHLDMEDLMNKLFWLELVAIIKKEWDIFAKVFGDKSILDQYTVIVNERPDAHAKEIDMFDAALHRKAVSWFEDKLARL
ncbi:hypothetical protein [Rhizobium leguminosarum]